MIFNSEFAKKWIDSTEADAIRTLRPGGPFDTNWYQTTCPKCADQINQTLRWFHNRDWRCNCGAEFDMKPMAKLLAERIADWLLATKTPDEIIALLEGDDSKGQ